MNHVNSWINNHHMKRLFNPNGGGEIESKAPRFARRPPARPRDIEGSKAPTDGSGQRNGPKDGALKTFHKPSQGVKPFISLS